VAKISSILVVLLMTLSGMTLLVPAAAADEAPMEVFATTDRTVLVELFTGADCPPCVNADHGLEDFIADHTRKEALALVYHRDIPRPDKLETTECVNRQGWYVSSGGHSTPNMWVDGKIVRVGGFNSRAAGEQWFETQYNTRRATKSEFSMNVDGRITTQLTGTVWVNVTALGTPTLSNLYLHTVIAREYYGPWNGGNGVMDHYYTVRKMLPNENGEAISISSGQTKSFQYNFDLSNDVNPLDPNDWFTVEDDMVVIAFVQTHTRTNAGSNRYAAEILQSTYEEFNAVPNVAPWISMGQAIVPPGATEDDKVTFKTFYWDVDDFADIGPSWAKVFYKNATSGVMEGILTKVSSGYPWIEGKWMDFETTLGPGTYTYRFAANDSEADARGDTGWNTTEFTIVPRNKVPMLSTYGFTPMEGDTNQVFRFDIKYRDGDDEQAVDANIYINGEPYAMQTDSTGPFTEWTTYYYETTMSIGDNHRFYYLFSDGEDTVRLPKTDASPNWLLGPTVVKPNYAPTLTTGLFTPHEGTRMDQFTFTIVYTDGERDHPTVSYIYVDEVPNIMDPDGYDYDTGEIFRFRTTMDLGTHEIRFLFNDGKSEVRFPPTGTIPGPTVINVEPMAHINAPPDLTPEVKRYTPDDYVPFSAVGSTDAEGDSLDYTWTSNIDGPLSTQEAFEKRLTEGTHTITLEVADEHGGAHSAQVTILVKALEPHPFIYSVVASDENPVETDMLTYTATLNNDGETLIMGMTIKFLMDDVEMKTDIVTVSVGNEVQVRYTWEAEPGQHVLTVEIPGDLWTYTSLVEPNTPPAATPEIIEPKEKYKPGEEIMFKAVATDANGDALAYHWDFGDGVTSTSMDPTHTYTTPATYTVTLTITDTRGGTTTETIVVDIAKKQSDGESPGFGALVAIAAFMAVIVAVSRRRR
jgi:PGF-CTERM protein